MLQIQHQQLKPDRRYQAAMQSPGMRGSLQHLTSLFNVKTLLVILLLPAVTPRSIPSPNSMELIAASRSLEVAAAAEEQKGTSEDDQASLRIKRSALRNDPTLWPDQRVPFVFEEPFPKRYKKQVMKAIGVWHKRTCIRFVDRTDEEYYAKFEISQQGCSSRVGLKKFRIYRENGQPVLLSISCLQNRGLIMHELGHLIGFYHEQQRPDRNNYIQILSNNIVPSLMHEFQMYNFTTYGDYDFDSIMHYPLNINTLPNATGGAMIILPNVTVPEDVEIGRRHTLSAGDYRKARIMYQCLKRNRDDVVAGPLTEAPTLAPTVAPTPVEAISGDNIYTGEQVALRVSGDNFPTSSWLSCSDRQCTVNDCLGRNFRSHDLRRCPQNVFYLHKIRTGTARRQSGVVRVGDSIVLERRTGFPPHAMSSYLFCNAETQVCSLSDICFNGQHNYNTTRFCREHVLIVKAEGKNDGDAITHLDLIGFEFEAIHDDIFEQRCALGCNPATRVCSKKLCVFSNSNSLHSGRPTDAAVNRVCGKDMFFVQKL